MNPRSTRNKETGMVLIFVVAAIFTLVILLGLFLDVGTMMIAKRDREKTARLVSSEAVTVFNRNTNDTNARIRDAKNKSQTLADTNLKLQFAKSFFKNKTEANQSFEGTSADSGSLVPGAWYFNQNGIMTKDAQGNVTCTEASINNCPCKNGQWNGPCFKPLSGLNSPEEALKVNAFSADLWTRDNNKMKTTFMGVVGQKEVSLRSQSTIAIRPLNVVVLVDLSRFVDEETHVPYEVVGLKGLSSPAFQYNPAKFAYPITNPGSCSATEPMTEVRINSLPPAEPNLTCRRQTPFIAIANASKSVCTLFGGNHIAPNFYSDIFNMTSPPTMFMADRTVLPATITDHYHTKFDYRCLSLNFQRVDGSNNTSAPYLIDFRRTPTYNGAEPLETFMQGVRESIKKIKERKLRGDSISVVGFDWDADVSRRRILEANPLDPPDPNQEDPFDGSKTKSKFEILERLFTKPYNPANPQGFYNHLRVFYTETGFIPRLRNRYLSIPYALNEAYDILKKRKNFATSDNMIILLTTGLTNCVRNGNTDQTCGQDAVHFENSVNETIKFAEDTLKKQGIVLHTLIRSPRVQPATKVIAGCKVEDNTQGTNFSNQYNYTSSVPIGPLDKQTGTYDSGVLAVTQPFQIPNNLAKASMVTGGVWAPVRPTCKGTVPIDPKTDFNNALTNYCKTPKVIADPKVIDANGNILCDPNAQTPEQQTTKYIGKMFDLTPLIPVSEGVNVN